MATTKVSKKDNKPKSIQECNQMLFQSEETYKNELESIVNGIVKPLLKNADRAKYPMDHKMLIKSSNISMICHCFMQYFMML